MKDQKHFNDFAEEISNELECMDKPRLPHRYGRLEKGSIIRTIDDDWFFVIVQVILKDNVIWLDCICDNANNTYLFRLDEVIEIWDTYQIRLRYTHYDCVLPDGRAIPFEVMYEVLSGEHDDRFTCVTVIDYEA